MADNGRILLDVIDDPKLLQSFLDEDSTNNQSNTAIVEASDVTTHANNYYMSNYQIEQYRINCSNDRMVVSNPVQCNGESSSLSSQPIPLNQPVPIGQVNPPSPSIFNLPSPAVASSVSSPAVPSPSQSAAVTSAPQAQNIIQQPGSQVQITASHGVTGTPVYQVVPQQRPQAPVRQKQIRPKPPGSKNKGSNSKASKKSASKAAQQNPVNAMAAQTPPHPGTQYVIGPNNTLIPIQVPSQNTMVLLNNGQILMNSAMIPSLPLAPHSTQSGQIINQNQMYPVQVAGQPTIIGASKPLPPNQQTILPVNFIPANAMQGALQNGNYVIQNNPIQPATVPSNQTNTSRPPGMVLAPRFVNNQPLQLQPIQTPQGQIAYAVPSQMMIPQQNIMRPVQQNVSPAPPSQVMTTDASVPVSTVTVQPPPPSVPEKPTKPKVVDPLAELVKQHGIDSVDFESTPSSTAEEQVSNASSQPVVLSIAQDGSVHFQQSSAVSESPPLPSTISQVTSTYPAAAPQSCNPTTIATTHHSVLLQTLNSAPMNGLSYPSQPVEVSVSAPLPSTTLSQVFSSSPPVKVDMNSIPSAQVKHAAPAKLPTKVSENLMFPITPHIASSPVIRTHQGPAKVPPVHYNHANTQLLGIQREINYLVGQKVLNSYERGRLHHLMNAQQLLVETNNLHDLKESVQMSVISSNSDSSAISNVKPTGGSQQLQSRPQNHVHLTNLLQRPSTSALQTPANTVPTVIQQPPQQQVVVNTSMPSSSPVNQISSVQSSNIRLNPPQILAIAPELNKHSMGYIPPEQNELYAPKSQPQQRVLLKLPTPPTTNSNIAIQLQSMNSAMQAPVVNNRLPSLTSGHVPINKAPLHPVTSLQSANNNSVESETPHLVQVKTRSSAKEPKQPLNSSKTKAAVCTELLKQQNSVVYYPRIQVPPKLKDTISALASYHVLYTEDYEDEVYPENWQNLRKLDENLAQTLLKQQSELYDRYSRIVMRNSTARHFNHERFMLTNLLKIEEDEVLNSEKKSIKNLNDNPFPDWLQKYRKDENPPSMPSTDTADDVDSRPEESLNEEPKCEPTLESDKLLFNQSVKLESFPVKEPVSCDPLNAQSSVKSEPMCDQLISDSESMFESTIKINDFAPAETDAISVKKEELYLKPPCLKDTLSSTHKSNLMPDIFPDELELHSTQDDESMVGPYLDFEMPIPKRQKYSEYKNYSSTDWNCENMTDDPTGCLSGNIVSPPVISPPQRMPSPELLSNDQGRCDEPLFSDDEIHSDDHGSHNLQVENAINSILNPHHLPSSQESPDNYVCNTPPPAEDFSDYYGMDTNEEECVNDESDDSLSQAIQSIM